MDSPFRLSVFSSSCLLVSISRRVCMRCFSFPASLDGQKIQETCAPSSPGRYSRQVRGCGSLLKLRRTHQKTPFFHSLLIAASSVSIMSTSSRCLLVVLCRVCCGIALAPVPCYPMKGGFASQTTRPCWRAS